ncbi:MAG: cytochrome c oxidase assembly protein [Chloroflexi bacterium]|nr:cytochrome c oxidase assembly protein [Chloroflexota bacterium]
MTPPAAPAEDPATLLLANWHGDASVLLGVLALAAGYLVAARRLRPLDAPPVGRWRVAAFMLGDLAVLLALYSPLHELSDHSLFSAHMVQHLLLTMAMPTLLLLGIPPWMLRPVLRVEVVARGLRVLTFPPVAYVVFNAAFAGSHVPAFYDLTLRQQGVHTLEHLVFMGAALLAWWPVLSPAPEAPPIPPPVQLLYLFLQTFPMLMVGALLTDASVAQYPSYAAAPRIWGISALDDQQAGGLIMWIGGSLFYLLVLTIVFFRGAARVGGKEPAVSRQ